MLQTLTNSYPTAAKTAEIMARYRPIAPKPETSVCPSPDVASNNSNALPPGISRSPFLRDVWRQLQARPTRSRKRGRSHVPPPPPKRVRSGPSGMQGVSPPNYHHRLISFQGGGGGSFPVFPNLISLKCGLDGPVSTLSSSVSLSFLPPHSAPLSHSSPAKPREERGIDLNRAAEDNEDGFFPIPVINPRPVRPVGSSIYVGRIVVGGAEEDGRKRLLAEEVEEEVETEVLPAVVSDSKNNVRLANSAYKEMVGQPECCWLDYMPPHGGGKRGRIGGEVVLHLLDACDVPMSSERFTCWVRIEWRSNDDEKKKNSVRAFCDAVKLGCKSRDYLFEWRFHTTQTTSPE
ncbi:unnamed protein product [Cuscuta europaea]|uniref:DUF7950 domain-containing protein n=1 Tax=Cuscuta europaea TaxID=41803 RepID=A0A9P0YGP1_CUSEU|nr:unnamed protein product [Cuscuta europaea]